MAREQYGRELNSHAKRHYRRLPGPELPSDHFGAPSPADGSELPMAQQLQAEAAAESNPENWSESERQAERDAAKVLGQPDPFQGRALTPADEQEEEWYQEALEMEREAQADARDAETAWSARQGQMVWYDEVVDRGVS